ncbi:MAG: AI-2E family transporter [Candidatus Liptonbacteria bacterium]|nr:AI-2E family transporter [Candidatus Liptonbacteria bacterium]
MGKTVLEISWTSLWKVLFFLMLASLMFFAKDIIMGLFLAIVLSAGLEIPIDAMEKRRLPRTIGAILIFLILMGIIAMFLYAVVPLVIVNINEAIFSIQKASHGTWWQSFFNIKTSRSINDFMSRIVDNFISTGTSPLETLSHIFGGLTLAISVFIISFYLSVNKNGVERFIKIISPVDYEENALRIFDRSRKRIALWFKAQFILSLMMGLLVWLALSLLGVKYAPMLGAIAGIMELVPFVGPILAGAISVLVAASDSFSLAVYTLIAFLVLQQVESNILVPLLMKRTAGLHPVLVIVSLLVGIEVGGFLGAIVAVPAAAIFEEIVEDRDRRKALKAAAQ